MNFLLINPPFYRFMGLEQDYVPLSLLAVGAQLEKDGHQVKIKNMEIDKNLSYQGYSDRSENFYKYLKKIEEENDVWDELRNVISSIRPDKIGITVLNTKFKSSLRIIDIAKEFSVPVMVGGPYPTTHSNLFPKHVEVIKGEFESRMDGKRIMNLDELDIPTYNNLLDNYSPNGYGHVYSSRGCPFKCTFCASKNIWNRIVSFKSPNRMVEEMSLIYKKVKNDSFTFWDETFTLNKNRLIKFCSLYNLPAYWNCDTRAESLDKEMVIAMKQANCKHISLGIESGVQRILNYIKKGETLEEFIRAANLLNDNGIKWKAYCIIGFPEEDERDIFETMRFIKSLKPFRITLSFFTPYPETELFTECLKMGLITSDYDPTLFAHQSPVNYFCPKIHKERFFEIKNIVSHDCDEYNKQSIKEWK